MTNLTTTHLKCLLEQATPGPWRISLTEGISGLGFAEDFYQDDPREKANVTLAAAAPQLAREVLRMRKELTDLQAEARYAAKFLETGPNAQRVFDALDTTINQILGDHNA